MKKKNILIFPCGSEIGLEIHNALSNISHFKLFGASSEKNNHGKFVFQNYIESLPYFDDKNFVKQLNKIIKQYKIDFIIPAHDSVLLELAKNIKNINCEIITTDYETCTICRFKSLSYKHFKDIIKTPTIYKKTDKINFPVFLKPDVGQGSKGTYLAKNKEDLNFYLKKDKSLLILEYLPGKEYTIDCFTNKNGKLLFASARQRARINNGISVNTKPIKNKKFNDLASKINRNLNFRGAWFFQVKENKKGDFVLMEIAPRIAGSMALYRNLGVNFAALSIYDKIGLDVSINSNKFDIELDRALSNKYKTNLKYNNIYIDFDDTILLDKNKINTQVISFIYQCLNHKKKVTLITKHKSDIVKTLQKYKIDKNIFSKIIHLKPNQNKHIFIKDKNSIFIDDSFAERQKVQGNCGITTFDINSIECLLDTRS